MLRDESRRAHPARSARRRTTKPRTGKGLHEAKALLPSRKGNAQILQTLHNLWTCQFFHKFFDDRALLRGEGNADERDAILRERVDCEIVELWNLAFTL